MRLYSFSPLHLSEVVAPGGTQVVPPGASRNEDVVLKSTTPRTEPSSHLRLLRSRSRPPVASSELSARAVDFPDRGQRPALPLSFSRIHRSPLALFERAGTCCFQVCSSNLSPV